MGFLRIHCKSCGGYWDLHEQDDYKNQRYKKCPYCEEEIDGQDYYNTVLPAFGAMMDATKELEKTSKGYNAPLFRVDYISGCKVIDDVIVEDDDEYTETTTGIDELTESVYSLRTAVEELTNALLTVDFVRKYS